MQITSNPKRRAVSTSVVVGIIIAVVVVAGVAIYFATTATPSTPRIQGQTTTSTVQVTIPSGAGIPPSNWNQSQIISNIYYSPDMVVVTIGVNNTVVWTNKDNVAHTVTSFSVPSGASTFDSGTFNSGATFKHTFQAPGMYKYFCTIHPWMGGQVIVKSG